MTALDVFNVLPIRDRGTVASPFYSHPYGGISRDIVVSRDGFARFFELDSLDMALVDGFAGSSMKLYDTLFDDWCEACGYAFLSQHGKITYSITMISRDHTRVGELLQIAPYLWEGNDNCDPHGIDRPIVDFSDGTGVWKGPGKGGN